MTNKERLIKAGFKFDGNKIVVAKGSGMSSKSPKTYLLGLLNTDEITDYLGSENYTEESIAKFLNAVEKAYKVAVNENIKNLVKDTEE